MIRFEYHALMCRATKFIDKIIQLHMELRCYFYMLKLSNLFNINISKNIT